MNTREIVNYVEKQRREVDRDYSNFKSIDYSKTVYVYSSLYNNVICVDGDDLINGDFNVEKYGLDKEFFNYPFYIRIESKGEYDLRNELIDKLSDNFNIVVDCNERTNLDNNSDNILYCPFGNWIDLEFLYRHYLEGNLYFMNDFSPVIEIRNIDSSTLYKLSKLKEISNDGGESFRYRVIIKDKETFDRFPDLIGELEDEVFVFIDDVLIDGDKSISSRNVIVSSDEFQEKLDVSGKKYFIYYSGIDFDDFSNLVGLEKCIDVLLSRIPKDASDLDKVVFLTMFMVNHFSYDYEDPEKFRTLFDFINDKKGVCRDYAAFASYLFKRVGVECVNTANTLEGESVGHAFNIVYLDDKKTLLDVTWLAEEYKQGRILSIVQSNNLLVDNESFHHEGYLDERHDGCVKIDREEIIKSILKVRGWKYKYYINKDMIIDLLRMGPKEKSSMEVSLESSMPGYGV